MSKLSRALIVTDIKKIPIFPEFQYSIKDTESIMEYSETREYTIEAKFSIKFFEPSDDERVIRQQIAYSKARIVHAVFGEFREPLMEALIEAKYLGADNIIQKLETVVNNMFDY